MGGKGTVKGRGVCYESEGKCIDRGERENM